MKETILSSENGIHQSKPELLHVWDPLLRLFHWSLAGSFVVAFVTEDDLLGLHVWAGYAILGLIFVRVLWGLVGPRYARWSNFIRPPGEILAYLKQVVRFRAPRYIGHNPAGGAMVVALLVSLVLTCASGVAVYGAQELSGPLAGVVIGLPEQWGHLLEEVHEVLASLTLVLVFLHLMGVLFASVEHRENLVWAMITGLKKRDTE